MAATEVKVQMQQRRDTAAGWAAGNRTLLSGELGFETDTKKIKIGDGSTAWNSLAYIPGFSVSAYPLATADIADDAVTAAKLADTAVTAGSYTAADITVDAQGRITAAASGTVGTAEIADGAITSAKLDTNITISGDLTVNGTTTTINSTTLQIDDKNIELGTVATPSDTTADGGGITLKGTTDHTIIWTDSTDSWDFSEHVNIASGKEFQIAGTSVLSATTLGSGVTGSSLTSVGTITTGVWNGTAIATAYIEDDAVTGDKLANDITIANDLTVSNVLKADTIESTSTTDGGIAIDSSGHVQIDGQQLPSSGPLSNRNLIINGAMEVAQRATQATGQTTSGIYTCDRVRMALLDLGTWTLDQASDGPPGFTKSFKATCTTADASPAAADLAYVQYRLEAQDLQHLNFGTSDAVAMTLSFWVKSNKTGTASFMMYQNDNSLRLFSTSYTISSADTWEYKTIAIPADTSGLINDDNGTGLTIAFWLNSGSNSTGGSYNTTWGTYADANTNINNLGVGGAVSDNYAITGIQLETGTVATPFEHRSYGDELARCQRYFFKHAGLNYGSQYGGNSSFVKYDFPVEMRQTPTITATYTHSGTVSTNYTTKHQLQQYITFDTSVSTNNFEADAELT